MCSMSFSLEFNFREVCYILYLKKYFVEQHFMSFDIFLTMLYLKYMV